MKFLTTKRFNGKLILLLVILAFLGIPSVSAYDDTIIGFRWNTSDSSPRLYQIDASGEVIANKPATFWNNDWNITANMKTVVVNASNSTPVLYGTNNRGDGLDLNGTYGDVMVEIPVFYTKSTFENGNFSYWISPLPSAGFAVAPMFNQRGTGTNAGTAAPYYYVGRYDANLTGSKLQSATGKAPAVSITINQARTYAENKGAGWGITNIWTLSGLRQLFYTEMLTLDSQTAWTGSRGIVDGNSAVFISGADGIDTAIYTINATGNGTGLNGKTPVSYRGIENLWGNVWQFQDGFTAIKGANNVSVINATGLGLTGQKTTFAIPLGANDRQSVGELPTVSNYQKELMITDVARPLFLPSAVGGSATTYLSDYYYYPGSTAAANPNILISGGSFNYADNAGIGALDATMYVTGSFNVVGARLEFRRSAAAPTVTAIDPNSGVNTSSVTVSITGTNFQTGSATTVNLTRAGQATITVTDLIPASTTSITGITLPISRAAAGIWNVTVINPDGQESGNLTTFTVTPPPPVASFSATPNHGNMPLSVSFTDESTGGIPTGWAWYFGDENYLGTIWTRQTSSAAWPARYMHTSVALPDGSIVLMGGYYSPNTNLNDTWRSTDQGKTWTEQSSSSRWGARYGHTSVALPDGSIVLMGGHYPGIYLNDTWRSTDQGKTWTEQSSNAAWLGRFRHTSVALPDGSIVLMGGYDTYTYYNDTWRSTDQGKTWTEQSSSSGWGARYGQTSVALPDGSIVLMGGRGSIYNKDTWRSTDQGKTWTEQNSSFGGGVRLSPASVALPDGSVILMGGYSSSTDYNDTWRSTDQGETWTEQNSNTAWPARYCPTSVALPDGSIVLMGGYDTYTYYNDTWRFVTANATQSPVHTYTAAGTYTVALQDYNAEGYNSTIKSGYIVVTTPTVPTVTSINPNSGTNTSSVTVSITGTNFNTTGTTTVNLTRAGQANLTVTGLTPASTTSITSVALPISGAATGIWNVTVINPDGQEGSNLSVTFTVNAPIPAPTVTSINPNSGTNTSSVTVSITGTNFNTTGSTTVNLTRAGQANLTVTGLTPASTTSITSVALPISGAATGIWNVTVINPDGQEGSNSSVTFTVNAAPPTTSPTPTSPPTPTAPTFVSATTNTAGTAISITFNKAMSNPTGNQNQFTYSVNGGTAQPFSAAVPGSNSTVIDLTTAGSTIAYGNVVTVNYTAGSVTSTDGGVLATFNNKAVTNAMPGPTPTAPTFVSATTNTAGTAISITFSKAMNNPTGDARNFSYSVNGGTAQTFSAAAPGSNSTVIDLTTAGSTIAYGNVVTVSYTAGTVTSTDGGVLATFNNQPVTNAVPGPTPTPTPTPTAPTFVSATTNTAGTAINITFSKAMNSPTGDARNFSYSVNGGTAQTFSAAAPDSNPTVIDLTTAGSTIAYGNVVTVNYTAGSVTSTDGGVLATFNNQPVTNAVPGPAPTLIVTPASGTTAGGTFVTITGTIFTGTKAVTLGGIPATNVTVVNDTAVTATTPAHTAGVVDIVVTTPGGPVTGPGIFTYLSSIEPPVANFAGTPVSGASPLTVTFIDHSTNYPTSWNWNFGDSKTSASQNPNHTYTNPGVYNVTLIVTNSAGSSSPYTAVKNITVSTPVNQSDTIFLGVHNIDVRSNSWLFNITDVVNAGGSVIDVSSTRIDYRPSGWQDIILTGSNITNDTRYIRGDSITLVVMTTPSNTHIFTGVGTARSQFVLNQKTLTQGATFGEALVPGANNSVTSRFQQAVQGHGASLNVIGYTVEISGAAPFNANKTETNSIFINLSASHSWVTANGGTGAIRILHLPESGSAEVLTTTYAGGDGTTDYFTTYSNGLSLYGLVGVGTSPTPTPTPTPTRAHRQAVGGYDSSGDPGYTGPTLTPAISTPTPLSTVKQTVVTVSGAGSTAPTIPPLPTNTPRSGLDEIPVLGALGLCGAIFLFRKNRN